MIMLKFILVIAAIFMGSVIMTVSC